FGGFTLVEMLVSLVIIGVVSTVAVIGIRSTQASRDLAAAAARLEQDLRWMQQVSINGNGVIDGQPLPRLVFNNAAVGGGWFITVNGKVVRDYKFNANIRTSGNPQPLTFQTDGRPPGGYPAIVLQNTKDVKMIKKLVIEPMTGRVRITDR
ncbi:MAG: prepilin-type N-terminal cleavage/methylation domain-containing protein, partial [Negativicutes bacterium]|nr:prepilin-type N-terminal cleavage/methylation domain-containing protein [Negativicutes bacterium]